MSLLESIIKGLECCTSHGYMCGNNCNAKCPYDKYKTGCVTRLAKDALELLKALENNRDPLALLKVQEPVGSNEKQCQCNKCEFYQGVHNVSGHAPCSFWNIGGVMWYDYCSRFSQFTDK